MKSTKFLDGERLRSEAVQWVVYTAEGGANVVRLPSEVKVKPSENLPILKIKQVEMSFFHKTDKRRYESSQRLKNQMYTANFGEDILG